ncbi:hypothetical protein CWATWH0003_5501t5, partial [Crocosphaera watsonii WH 0003]
MKNLKSVTSSPPHQAYGWGFKPTTNADHA